MAKLITARDAAEMIQDGDAVICATFGASGVPADIYMELEKRFLETGHPRSLTYTHAAGSGSFAAQMKMGSAEVKTISVIQV